MDRRVFETTNGDGGIYTTQSYDAAGNLVLSTDELGRTTQYVCDSHSRVVETINPDGTVVTTDYDGDGNLVRVTDARGTTTIYQYDLLGRKTAEIPPVPGGSGAQGRPTTLYTYDDNGNLLSVTDPRGYVTSYQYDADNRLIAETQPDTDGGGPLTTRYFYDNNGNLRCFVIPLGTDPSQIAYTTEYQYDALNRKTAMIQPAPDGSGPLFRPTTFYTYDQNGNLATVTDPNGNVTIYQCDKPGRLIVEADYVNDDE